MKNTTSSGKGRLNKTAKKITKLYGDKNKKTISSGEGFIKWADGQDIMLEFHACPRTLNNWRLKKIIEYAKLGNKLYYNRTALEEKLKESCRNTKLVFIIILSSALGHPISEFK